MPRPPLSLYALVAIAIVLSACGASAAAGSPDESAQPMTSETAAPASAEPSAPADDGGPSVAGTDLNACEIVSAADVEAALAFAAGTVAEGELKEDPTTLSPGHSTCRYTGDWGGLVVSLTPEDGENLYDAARNSYADASDRVITGSDGAFWSEHDKRGFFWKGAVTAMLQITHLTAGGDYDEATVAMGQAAIDKVE